MMAAVSCMMECMEPPSRTWPPSIAPKLSARPIIVSISISDHVHDLGGYLVERDHLIGKARVDDSLRHAVDRASFLVLCERFSALFLNQSHPFPAVMPHPRKNDAHRPAGVALRDRAHADIHARLVQGPPGLVVNMDIEIHKPPFSYFRLRTAGRQEYLPRAHLLAIFSLFNGELAQLVQPFGERSGESLWHVDRHEKGSDQPFRQIGKHLLQSPRPA